MVKSEHLLNHDLSCHQATLYTNYTNYLTKLAVTKTMQILISVYYFSNKFFIQAKPIGNSAKKCFWIFPLYPYSFKTPKP